MMRPSIGRMCSGMSHSYNHADTITLLNKKFKTLIASGCGDITKLLNHNGHIDISIKYDNLV